MATDFRYTEQAELQAPDFRVDRISGGLGWLPELFKELGVRRVGFESGHMTVALHSAIVTALKEDEAASEVSLIATAQFIDPLRAIKEPEELALLTRAMEIADHAFAVVAPTIEVGDTEESVAWRLELAMREAGAEAVAFETIIAAGPNAAKPHHHPTERRIAAGEPVVMDFGARYLGYNSDMTRTICLGEPDEMFRIVYDTVLNAQMTASVTVDPTMNSGEADGIARDIIDKAGYGERFGHSLGHGIGLAVHEYPRVSPRCRRPAGGRDGLHHRTGHLHPGLGWCSNRRHRGHGERQSALADHVAQAREPQARIGRSRAAAGAGEYGAGPRRREGAGAAHGGHGELQRNPQGPQR